VNGVATKTIKAASKAYEALAEAYEELHNMPKLKAQAKIGAETWAEVCKQNAHVWFHQALTTSLGW
jgi:hypothetical protein